MLEARTISISVARDRRDPYEAIQRPQRGRRDPAALRDMVEAHPAQAGSGAA